MQHALSIVLEDVTLYPSPRGDDDIESPSSQASEIF